MTLSDKGIMTNQSASNIETREEQTNTLYATTNGINTSLRSPTCGVMQIDDKPATSIRFERKELDGLSTFTVSFHLGHQSVAKLKNVDSLGLIDAVGEKNAKTIITHSESKGSLKGQNLQNEYGLSPEENKQRLQVNESQKAAEIIRLEQKEPDAIDESNIIEPVPQKKLERMDSEEVVAPATMLRQHEREQERLVLAAVNTQIDIKSLSEKAIKQNHASDIADQTVGTTDWRDQTFTEREKTRQIELMEHIHGQFRVSGAKFHFKDQPGKIAFKDKGERMVSASNDDRVTKAMAAMADAKGWSTIKVSGHPDFQREVWMEANLRGIKVRGFKPNEQDVKTLEDRRERNMRNTVEPAPTELLQKVATERNGPTEGQQTTEKPQKRINKDQGSETTQRAYKGRLIEHGTANYKQDPDEKLNYFLKLETDAGEKTVWGLDLKRAISKSNAKTGDEVRLEFKGNQPVTVETLLRDKAGKVIGSEKIGALRNTWEVQKSDKHKVVEAVASALIDANIKDPTHRQALKTAVDVRLVERAKGGTIPTVPMYDKKAPAQSKQPERVGPQVARNAERSR